MTVKQAKRSLQGVHIEHGRHEEIYFAVLILIIFSLCQPTPQRPLTLRKDNFATKLD